MFTLKTLINLAVALALLIGGGYAVDASLAGDANTDIAADADNLSMSAGVDADTEVQAEVDNPDARADAHIGSTATAGADVKGGDDHIQADANADADANAQATTDDGSASGSAAGSLSLFAVIDGDE